MSVSSPGKWPSQGYWETWATSPEQFLDMDGLLGLLVPVVTTCWGVASAGSMHYILFIWDTFWCVCLSGFEGDFIEGKLKAKACYCQRQANALWSYHALECFKNVSDIYLSFCGGGGVLSSKQPGIQSTLHLWWHLRGTGKPRLGSCLKCGSPKVWDAAIGR